MDPDGLDATVADANRYARTGVDEEFGKGTSVFGHQYGDPAHTPNTNLGPIETAPFYAIAVVPTPLGTALGLRTDPSAQVLDEAGAPIPGLYACGNDAQSVMGVGVPGCGLPGRGGPDVRLRGGAARSRRLTRPCSDYPVLVHTWPAVAPSAGLSHRWAGCDAGWVCDTADGVRRAPQGARRRRQPPGASPGPGPASSRCR